jgi:uncharacterized cofD-like protein
MKRIVVLGGGEGLASVLRALGDDTGELSVIVTVADDGESSGQLRQPGAGPAVGDLRRSLVTLTGDEVVLGRALGRPVTVAPLGRHPLGNLMILSIAEAFGDLAHATEWLGARLGISGRVLPATAEPVCLVADADGDLIYGETAIGDRSRVLQLRFIPECPAVPPAVVDAIERADLCLLAPGSLFTSVIATSALPTVAAALARTAAPVVWICNLQPDAIETARMAGADHLAVLRRHGVPVDVALFDPRAELQLDARQLEDDHVRPMPRPLQGPERAVHDRRLLRAAIGELLDADAGTATGSGDSGTTLVGAEASGTPELSGRA